MSRHVDMLSFGADYRHKKYEVQWTPTNSDSFGKPKVETFDDEPSAGLRALQIALGHAEDRMKHGTKVKVLEVTIFDEVLVSYDSGNARQALTTVRAAPPRPVAAPQEEEWVADPPPVLDTPKEPKPGPRRYKDEPKVDDEIPF